MIYMEFDALSVKIGVTKSFSGSCLSSAWTAPREVSEHFRFLEPLWMEISELKSRWSNSTRTPEEPGNSADSPPRV